jgi:hypothetical protein
MRSDLVFGGTLSCVQPVPALPIGEQGHQKTAQAEHTVAGHNQRGSRPLPFNQPGIPDAGKCACGQAN